MKNYDLIVLGAGPGGEKAAVKAAYFGYSVALIDSRARASTPTSSSTPELSVKDFLHRKHLLAESENQEMTQNLIRHKVDIFRGRGKMVDPNTVAILGHKEETIRGDHIVIATGSTPERPDNIPFDGQRIHDTDTINSLTRLPTSLCIIGASVAGLEYASHFSTLGVPVYIVQRHEKLLPFVDDELCAALVQELRSRGVELLTQTDIKSVEAPKSSKDPVRVPLKSGETLSVDMVLYAIGHQGNTSGMGLEEIGVSTTSRGSIDVDADYRTSLSHVYAVGEVIGAPSLAGIGTDQGRIAVAHMFKLGDIENSAEVYPYCIHTLPEVSGVGITEQEAKRQGLNYCVGRAYHKQMARGKMLGLQNGMMKIVFNKDDLTIRGVHLLGNLSAEIIHYGVTLVEGKKTLKQVISTTFNYPTLHDLYKYASYDGLGNLSGHKVR